MQEAVTIETPYGKIVIDLISGRLLVGPTRAFEWFKKQITKSCSSKETASKY